MQKPAEMLLTRGEPRNFYSDDILLLDTQLPAWHAKKFHYSR
jgi:hypothetical protein